MNAATLTRGASWSRVPDAGEARTREGAAVAASLSAAIDRGLYSGTALAAAIDSAPDRDDAIRETAERMVREAQEADAYNGRAVESAAEWGAERGYKVWAPRKAAAPRRKRGPVPNVLVRVALEPLPDADAERQHREGAGYDVLPLARHARASRARRKIENASGIAWRVYPPHVPHMAAYVDAAERERAAKAHRKLRAEHAAERADVDAWRDAAPRYVPAPAAAPVPRKRAPVIVSETVAAPAPAPVPVSALPADAIIAPAVVECPPGENPGADPAPTHAVPWGTRWGLRGYYAAVPAPGPVADVVPIRPDIDPAPAAIDSPRDPAGEGDPVADYLARLIHAPKRAFAEALIRGENPPDPGRPWAAKVRRTLARYGVIS